jgi:hypothetical protein
MILSEETLKDRVLGDYPTPIALLCKTLFDEKTIPAVESVVKVFDTFWFLLGSIAASQYLAVGAPSLTVNLHILTSIRSINQEKWVRAFKKIIPELSDTPLLPGLLTFYREIFYRRNNPVYEFQKFKRRISIDYLPPDIFEIERAKVLLFEILEQSFFLSNLKLIACDETGIYLLKGCEKQEMVNPPPIRQDQVAIFEDNKKEAIILSPFLKPSSSKSGIKFSDFRKEQEAYRQLIRTKNITQDITIYQSLLSGKPIFKEDQKDKTLKISFSDIKDKIKTALDSKEIRNILIESKPGGGKTLLVSNIEEVIGTNNFIIAKYYLQSHNLTSSVTIFSKFLYQQLNNVLDKPYTIDPKGDEWKSLREKITQDFSKSGKRFLLVIDSIDIGTQCFDGEKYSIVEFLNSELPTNLKILMTTISGIYPNKFDVKITIPPLTWEQLDHSVKDKHPKDKLEKLLNFYGGLRGYINEILNSNYPDLFSENIIPEIIGKRFNNKLFQFDYFDPSREEIFRYLSTVKEPVTLQKISLDLDISSPIVLNHISKILPLLKVYDDNGAKYNLFIPALSFFVRKFEKNNSWGSKPN